MKTPPSTVNASGFRSTGGRARRAILNGRRYLVATASLIVPGVLAGSQGPLYYPAKEVARYASAWNGIPVVVNHPTDHFGTPLSGQDQQVIDTTGIGWVFNSHWKDGKHRAELWFDVENTKRVDRRIYEWLVAGKAIELSTGLHTDTIPSMGAYNGRQYTHIARRYRPDHLAILPDMVGACGIEDGCGVLVN